jgi:hypothetical protein|tara:strand:+ start:2232 stop:2378 length:147 start_codon:yes stop_codon:yes gene_type:complete
VGATPPFCFVPAPRAVVIFCIFRDQEQTVFVMLAKWSAIAERHYLNDV